MPNCWDDSIGVARSRDGLETFDMDYPYELAIPQRPGATFDSCWTGWPKALVIDQEAHVFFAAGGWGFVDAGSRHYADTAVRRISMALLARWE